MPATAQPELGIGPSLQTIEAERASTRETILSRLNDRQKAAVGLGSVSALVLAGAGSGKTSVLTARVAYLVNEGHSPRSIMAVTFTNKAAEEMRKRLHRLLPKEAVSQLWIGTFHSLCNRMLRENHEAAGLPKNFGILDTDAQETVIKQVAKDTPVDGFTITSGRKKKSGGDIEDNDDAEAESITTRDVVAYINKQKERGLTSASAPIRGPRERALATLFLAYERSCEAQGVVDFNDLMTKTVSMLQSNSGVLSKYRDRFRCLLIDEFQDTNEVQYRWLSLLADPSSQRSRKSFVMAVGDDDQSIYRWRNARPEYMQTFLRDFADGLTIKLEQNYRSLPYILSAANALISRNAGRLGKTLWTRKPDGGEKILCTEFASGYAEASAVARKIHSLIRDRGVPGSEIAVLYRTNSQSRLIETELNKLGVPVCVYGGFRFYARQEVVNVMAYLDLAASFDRDVSFSRVVNFPPRGLGERTVEDLRQEAKAAGVCMMEMVEARSRSPQAGAAVKKQAALEQFCHLILDLAEDASKLTLSGLIESVLSKTGISAHYSAMRDEESEERMSNIDELIAAARQFEADHPDLNTAIDALPEYLSFVALMSSTSQADMARKDTVSLMTVHSAKGLEFDQVFVVGLEEGIFPHARAIAGDEDGESSGRLSSVSDAAWQALVGDDDDDDAAEDSVATRDSVEIEEERRLAYVALTRARKTLEISHARIRQNGRSDSVMEPSRFLAEIPKNLLRISRDGGPPVTQARNPPPDTRHASRGVFVPRPR